MSLPYKHTLIIGATSGIGLALAERIINSGTKVTVVGRRTSRLEAFVAKHGSEKAKFVTFDISKLEEIPGFAADVMKESPGIDSVILNAGFQNTYNFASPETVDLSLFNLEMTTNYSSMVALTHAFLPYFLKKDTSSIIFTGSNIAIVPAYTLPAYCASKTALNVFILCLREQLKGSSVRVIEISPPPVQTEIHDKQMGVEVGRNFGMPVAEFTDLAYSGLEKGEEEIYVGFIVDKGEFDGLVRKRVELFGKLSGVLREHAH